MNFNSSSGFYYNKLQDNSSGDRVKEETAGPKLQEKRVITPKHFEVYIPDRLCMETTT